MKTTFLGLCLLAVLGYCTVSCGVYNNAADSGVAQRFVCSFTGIQPGISRSELLLMRPKATPDYLEGPDPKRSTFEDIECFREFEIQEPVLGLLLMCEYHFRERGLSRGSILVRGQSNTTKTLLTEFYKGYRRMYGQAAERVIAAVNVADGEGKRVPVFIWQQSGVILRMTYWGRTISEENDGPSDCLLIEVAVPGNEKTDFRVVEASDGERRRLFSEIGIELDE